MAQGQKLKRAILFLTLGETQRALRLTGEEANTSSFRETLNIPSAESEECTASVGRSPGIC